MAQGTAWLDENPGGRARNIVTGGGHRVARIITRLNIGGPSIQAIILSRQLSLHGFPTYLIHGRRSANEGYMGDLLTVSADRITHEPSLVRSVSPLSDVRALWSLFRALHEWKPHIVHTHMAKAGALGRLAAILYNSFHRGAKTRLVHTYHGHVFEGYFSTRSTKVFLAVERWLAKYTDAVIAISPQVRYDIVHTYGIAAVDRVEMIPLGFELARFTCITADDRLRARRDLQISEDVTVVATVGRLTAIKSQSLLLKAAARLRDTCELQLLIVGDGELRSQLEAEARKIGVANCTRFLGWRGDLETIYAATDIFVLTSRNEGTPVALIEAMAAGVASVSTDVGGVRDVITSAEEGVVVPYGDDAALAAAVKGLADDPQRRSVMGERARVSVGARYAQQRLIADISSLYRRLLGNGTTSFSPSSRQ